MDIVKSVKNVIPEIRVRKPKFPYKLVLKSVRKLLKGKWIRGDYSNRRGNYCLVGAVNRVTGARHISEEAPKEVYNLSIPDHELTTQRLVVLRRIWRAILAKPGSRGPSTSIEGWNDQPGRTEEEILAVLDRALQD